MIRLLMDIDRIRYFCAIAQTGSMRKASELLRISPPALSKATRLLEAELGSKLIEASGRGIELTDQGRRFAKRAGELVKEFERLRNSFELDRTRDAQVKIATFEVFSTYALKFLDLIDWDDHALVLHEMIPGEVERALKERLVDYGITMMPVPLPGLDFLKICAIPMGVYSRKDLLPTKVQKDLPFVVPAPPVTGSPSRVRGLDGWPDDSYSRNVKFEVTLMESALELCRQGRAAGYFPQFVIHLHNRQVRDEFKLIRRLPADPDRICTTDVFLVKRSGEPENQLTKQLTKAVRMICKSVQ